jgi:hypothetical protein
MMSKNTFNNCFTSSSNTLSDKIKRVCLCPAYEVAAGQARPETETAETKGGTEEDARKSRHKSRA